MDKNFYIKSRERVAKLLPNGSAMILFAGKDIRESEDQSYEFCINRNFYYLTGVNEQNDIFVMIKDEDKIKNIMKKLSIILFLCVSVCNYIFASPAHPGPYLRIQPNGDTICVCFFKVMNMVRGTKMIIKQLYK